MTPSRFKPTRAGIIGLWDYVDDTFAFADGRLVLRGANGSGKTKALEVLFPFVLDGRLDPRRLDPFSGENRTMKENLLWRGTDTGHGYAWIEFACPAIATGDTDVLGDTPADRTRDADAEVRHVTVGVGLRAQRHRTTPTSWFFVADGRVGHDIHLVVDNRPVTRRQLADELGDDAVVDRATEHRRRVDATLFGLGAERYESMLDLVLTLRRPMLAKDLDPRLLSETLTRGLRPLDDDLLEQVARSFDDLEAVQRDLDQLATADDATQRFLTDYRGYLRTHARHRADVAIEAALARTAAVERQRDAHRALDEARAAEALAEAEVATTEDQLATDRSRRDALKASEAYQTAGQLEHLERSVRDLGAEAERAEARRSDAEAAREQARAAHETEQRRQRGVAAEVDRVRPRLAATAPEAGIEWSDEDGDVAATAVRQRVEARVAARRADLDAVRELLTAVLDADRRVTAADEAVGRAEDADEQAAADLRTAADAVAAARDGLGEGIRAWAADHGPVVSAEDRDAVAAGVVRAGHDDAVLPAEAWRQRLAPRREAAASQRTRLQDTAVTLAEQRQVLTDRRQSILDELDDAPPLVDWRGHGRDQRAGAPLWRLVRFADDIDPATAAGVEAALEAAGLLDAWVTPDGALPDGVPDAFLTPASEATPTPAPAAEATDDSLASVLVPDDQAHVPATVVADLLAGIRLVPDDGSDRPGVRRDGRYRLGPLAGAHRIHAPRYIGASARAAHRAVRVASLDEELTQLDREADRLTARLDEVARWLTAADEATAALPPVQPLLGRVREHDTAAGRRQQSRTVFQAATADAQAARREATDRRNALRREAGRRGLPAEADELADVADAVDRFADDGRELVDALRRLAERDEAVTAAAARAGSADARAGRATEEAEQRRREHTAREAEYTTLRDRMGADAAAVLDELEQVESSIAEGEARRREREQQARTAAAARGSAETEVTAAGEAVAAADDQQVQAARRLAVLARPDLAGPLDLDVHTGAATDADADEGVDLAADPEALLAAVDELTVGVSAIDERRKAAQTRITRGLEELQASLGSGYHPTWDVEDDVIVVTVADDLGVRSVAAFAHQLATQRADQEALLTARERALFEDALLTSVCGQIHTRIQATRELVQTMDAEMRSRRLSSGQTVGVAWRAGDTATAEWKHVHRLLDQDPAHFGPDQLDELRRHFSTEIKAARAADPQAPYRELLADVLDYRTWRRFELFLVEADGTESPLTRARHARLSGGEKAASLHLPLFAAAHAAFDGARADCPRLLGLDEAFAGIDDQGRSELLSLAVTFDLDLFMTGYDLWAVDPVVPAVAHYDLLHLADEHAVSALLVLWNGTELVEGPDAEAALAGTAGP